ncbi:MAG: class I SAM-dependent methyltransferase [Planctomycetes bacterium]|nr:class I SAM-dependent methyltransferase [Planctomycetota bacterium]
MSATGPPCPQRRWLRLAARVARLALAQPQRTGDLVQASYDSAAPGYDAAWTDHMRGLSLEMLDRLALPQGAECLDLACGTGFVTEELARRSGRRAAGVDASPGMLAVARRERGVAADFTQADAAAYLASRPDGSADVVTCAWALGYTRPWRLVRGAARVLRPGGRLGVIDNSLFSLAEVVGCSLLAFAERPEALVHVMNVRFLPAAWTLAAMMRAAALRVAACWSGWKTYYAPTGRAAIERLTATGAAAGFEFAAAPAARDAVFARFAELMDARRTERGVPVTHRYIAAIGEKP